VAALAARLADNGVQMKNGREDVKWSLSIFLHLKTNLSLMPFHHTRHAPCKQNCLRNHSGGLIRQIPIVDRAKPDFIVFVFENIKPGFIIKGLGNTGNRRVTYTYSLIFACTAHNCIA
jgi:hypothetical protein